MEAKLTKVAVIGGSGYTGLELIRLIHAHPRLQLTYVTSEQYAGQKIRECYPFISPSINLRYQPLDIKDAFDAADTFFLALPHGISLALTPRLRKKEKIVIDLSADYRLKNLDTYQKIYGKTHSDKALVSQAVYGLPEIYRHQISSSSLIANPGCYATSIILGLIPILKAGLVNNAAPIIADSKSGISGAGRKAEATYLFTECDQNIKPYKIGKHRHVPEIEQELNLIGQSEIHILLTPQLVPIRRGILSNLYIPMRQNSPSMEKIWEIYQEFYHKEPFTLLSPLGSIPCIKDVYLSNFCRLGLTFDQRTNTLVVVSTIDNLLKGAAGQAVQNLNIIMGFDEKMGLSDAAPYP